jgi:predicted subunit of tRNA(5-methylaminomethyl-2-thiouridylate) methyltransferase
MRIITFYNEVVNPSFVDLQKKIFHKYGYDIEQINVKHWTTHGDAVNQYLSKINDENEIIVLFDIDCVPLNNTIIHKAVDWCKNNIGIFSLAQKAVKLKDPIIHAAPAFMVFSVKTYNFLGQPSFETNLRSDCGAEMTHSAREKGIEIRMLYPSHVESPYAQLDGTIQFGYGTTYGNEIYHAFESRFRQRDSFFINKCNSILNENGRNL